MLYLASTCGEQWQSTIVLLQDCCSWVLRQITVRKWSCLLGTTVKCTIGLIIHQEVTLFHVSCCILCSNSSGSWIFLNFVSKIRVRHSQWQKMVTTEAFASKMNAFIEEIGSIPVEEILSKEPVCCCRERCSSSCHDSCSSSRC